MSPVFRPSRRPLCSVGMRPDFGASSCSKAATRPAVQCFTIPDEATQGPPATRTSDAMHSDVLQLDPRDNVLIALTDLRAGEPVAFNGQHYQLPKSVPAKHKFATQNRQIGDEIIMYGVLVGKAVKPIAA